VAWHDARLRRIYFRDAATRKEGLLGAVDPNQRRIDRLDWRDRHTHPSARLGDLASPFQPRASLCDHQPRYRAGSSNRNPNHRQPRDSDGDTYRNEGTRCRQRRRE